MLPRIANQSASASISGTEVPARRVPKALTALDAALFEPSGWFAIDSGNARVPGVVVPSLEGGLAMVGQGAVASIVGRLRPGVCVVDVDLVGEPGHAAAEVVVAWARQRGLWSLVRPSGGADGRAHVFVATGSDTAALTELIVDLRGQFGASTRDIDIRRAVRPLSAPHRTGGHTPLPYGSLTKALAELRQQILPAKQPAAPASTARSWTATATVALSPRPRRRAGLPPVWDAYLRTGVLPAIGGTDHSRSTVEAIATGHLLRAGHTAASAWAAVEAAHPSAMTKARASQRRWLAWVWNRAVQDDNAYRPAPRIDPAVAAAVSAARTRLQHLQWAFPARHRPALLLVGHHVLDRMARTNSRRVPVPERDLVLDTGITDRKTVRAVLRALNGHMGVLDTNAWDPRIRSSSSFEFEIPEALVEAQSEQGVRLIPPPSFHTPLPLGTWGSLPRICHSLWRALQTSAESLTCAALAQLAGITSSLEAEATPSQVRSTREGLTVLARAGLAHCTAEARWVARAALEADHARRATTAQATIAAAVAVERADYRAGGVSPWSVARAAALKATHAREQAWWGGLETAERARRRAAWVGRYAALSVVDQEGLKASLATRRLRAGVDEPARHDRWLDNLSIDAYLERCSRRQAWFAQLAPPLQQANAAAWARHRDRFAITRGTQLAQSRREHADLMPTGRQLRDQAFNETQTPLLPGLGHQRTG